MKTEGTFTHVVLADDDALDAATHFLAQSLDASCNQV